MSEESVVVVVVPASVEEVSVASVAAVLDEVTRPSELASATSPLELEFVAESDGTFLLSQPTAASASADATVVRASIPVDSERRA